MPMMILVPSKGVASVGLTGGMAGLVGAVTQNDFALWAGGLTVVGGAALWLLDRHTRNRIETSAIERDGILRDAKAETRDLRKELHDVRDELNAARIKLAVAEVMATVNRPGPDAVAVERAANTAVAALDRNTVATVVNTQATP